MTQGRSGPGPHFCAWAKSLSQPRGGGHKHRKARAGARIPLGVPWTALAPGQRVTRPDRIAFQPQSSSEWRSIRPCLSPPLLAAALKSLPPPHHPRAGPAPPFIYPASLPASSFVFFFLDLPHPHMETRGPIGAAAASLHHSHRQRHGIQAVSVTYTAAHWSCPILNPLSKARD